MSYEQQQDNVAVAAPAKPTPKKDRRPKLLPPYHVVLLDDNDHSYEYVILMLNRLFGHTVERGYQLACEVDASGRCIIDTTTKERAELKQEQVHAFGPDPLISNCKGSMSCVIEPAEG
jgi:ATP-dependent Clp protease adaptor protein ClpS